MKIWYIIALLLLVGCNGGNKNDVAQNNNLNQDIIKVKNTNIPEVDRVTGQDIAKHLVELTTSLPNVNDATAVVLGPFAIVGIDVNANVERSQVGSIKYTVAESLKKDPHGARAVVVADPDITARLKEVQEDIKNGKPIQGIMNELADISGRLMPEIPADIIDKNTKRGVEDPKKQLNTKDKHKLENKQDEHSNYHK
ncbi:YhcN/YlaJ family sporulation lipoprotein [Pseudoneobacillus sp. C159]